MKVEIFGTQKSAMPLSFSNFDFLPIYKAETAGSRTYPFACIKKIYNQNGKYSVSRILGPSAPEQSLI